MSVSKYVRPQSFSDFNDIWYVDRGRSAMQDGMPYDPIQSQGHGLQKFRKLHFPRSISSTIYNGSWKMTTDS